jgi:hypothetical protein
MCHGRKAAVCNMKKQTNKNTAVFFPVGIPEGKVFISTIQSAPVTITPRSLPLPTPSTDIPNH